MSQTTEIKDVKYMVLKVGRKSNRKTILRRNLTEAEAQQVVKSYPDNNRSMVYYTRQ